MKQIFRILFVLLMLPLVAYAGDGDKGEKKESFVKKRPDVGKDHH